MCYMRKNLKALLLITFLLLTYSGQLNAQNSEIGAGIIVGEPTGVCAKLWLDASSALNAAAAWSFIDKGAFQLHLDYIMHGDNLTRNHINKLVLYYGIGGRIKLEKDSRLGVRIPVGLNYQFSKVPFDIFLEVVPILDIIPKTSFKFNGAFGARFFFN